jgi:hypothetical protein
LKKSNVITQLWNSADGSVNDIKLIEGNGQHVKEDLIILTGATKPSVLNVVPQTNVRFGVGYFDFIINTMSTLMPLTPHWCLQ